MVRQDCHTPDRRPQIRRFYRRLLVHFGPQQWWPGRTRFEIILGAILTQNTNWGNVAKAIANLRRAGALSPRSLAQLPPGRLRHLLRPSGYFRQKARTVSHFLNYLRQYNYSVRRMFRGATQHRRTELLALRGIGEETADSILLYAGNRPVFVIDAYTRRILMRHGLAPPDAPYAELQQLFERNLPPRRARLYNEYHALLVAAGKRYCHREQPLCHACPLGPELEGARARL